FELHQRLAHRSARTPEALGERRGAQPLARPELTRENRLSQFLGDAKGARRAGDDRRGGAQGVHTKSRRRPESNPGRAAFCIQNAGCGAGGLVAHSGRISWKSAQSRHMSLAVRLVTYERMFGTLEGTVDHTTKATAI